MAKNPTYKPSANSSRKSSYSHEASPLHSSKLKKETRNVFQPADLDPNLKISLKSSVKKNEPKLLTANVFINNLSVHMNSSHLNQKRIAAPLSATIANRKNSNQYVGLSQKEEAALAEYRQNKLSQRSAQGSGGTGTIPKKVLSGPTQYEFQKNQVALVPKPSAEGQNDLSKSSFIAKFKGTDPTNKFTLRSPAKVFSQTDNANKFKKPNSRGQQKSFDVNATGGATATKYNPYLGSMGKPPSTANNSPRNRDNTEDRVTKTENTGRVSHTNNKPRSGRVESEKSTPAPRVVTKSPMIVSKHRKTPSFDITKRSENIQQKTMTPPILDRMRKSADHGDYRQANAKELDQSTKPSFRFAIRTRAGVAPNGTRKINQDSFIFQTNFGKKSDRHLIGVCDGHGTNGHFVSGYVKDIIPAFLLADPNFESKTNLAFVNAFELCQQKLMVSEFDCKFSGTTAVVLLLNGNKIISANSGDSRAIMGTYNKGWGFTALSDDHKPDTPQEALRIQKAGGRIEAFRDMDGNFVGPSRVWLMHQDIPGLAMSRSLGDIVASTVGVSCIPEMKEFTISPNDKFLIVASDGIWEFIESIDVVNIVAPFYEKGNIEGACDLLLGIALRRWQEEEEVVVDDITLIILFF